MMVLWLVQAVKSVQQNPVGPPSTNIISTSTVPSLATSIHSLDSVCLVCSGAGVVVICWWMVAGSTIQFNKKMFNYIGSFKLLHEFFVEII